MPRPPLVLLPPSLGKAIGGKAIGGATAGSSVATGPFDEALAEPRHVVVDELARVLRARGAHARAALFAARGDLLERAVEAATATVEGRAPVLPAWKRYTGVVWTHLDPATLTPATRKRILVPSGLYGLTTGTDLIADERLPMGARLGRLGNIAAYWRAPVTDVVADHCRGRTVVDMLPAEHARAVDLVRLAERSRLVTVRFLSADGRRMVGHDAKATKGALARAVLESGVEAAHHFTWRGWTAELRGDQIDVVAPQFRWPIDTGPGTGAGVVA